MLQCAMVFNVYLAKYTIAGSIYKINNFLIVYIGQK